MGKGVDSSKRGVQSAGPGLTPCFHTCSIYNHGMAWHGAEEYAYFWKERGYASSSFFFGGFVFSCYLARGQNTLGQAGIRK